MISPFGHGDSTYHFGGSAAPAWAETREAILATTAQIENFMLTVWKVVKLERKDSLVGRRFREVKYRYGKEGNRTQGEGRRRVYSLTMNSSNRDLRAILSADKEREEVGQP